MIAIVVCALGLLVQQTQIASTSDHQLFDTIQRITSYKQQDAEVLLVYSDAETLHGDGKQLVSLLEKINGMGAAKIALISPEQLGSLDQLAALPFADKIAIGCRRSHWHAQNQSGLTSGIIDLMHVDQLVYRDHYLLLHDVNNANIPTLQCAIAAEFLQPQRLPKQNRFGIRYCGSTNSLPNVTADQIIDGSVVVELVEDKVVMISAADPHYDGWRVPTTRNFERMSRLEIHGHVLETLLRGNGIFDCSWSCRLLLLSIFSAFWTILILRCRLNQIPLRTAAAIVLVLALTIVAYQYLHLRIPFTALTVSTSAAAAIVVFLRFAVLERYVRQLQLSAQKNIREELSSWELIRLSALQMFYPLRMIILELPPGKTHVRVADYRNCDEAHIAERRRDVQRFPFRQVIEGERPRTFPGYSFFTDDPADRVEYYIPLMHDSVVLGMVIASLSTDMLKNWPDIDDCLSRFSTEMSRMLFERMVSDSVENESPKLADRINTLPEDSILQAILRGEQQVHNQLQRWEHVFHCNDSAIAVCDPFGRVAIANEKLSSMLARHQLIAADTNTLELLSKLADRSVGHCRRLVRSVLNQRKESRMFLPANESGQGPYSVSIKPIITSSLGETTTQYPHLVIEIVDGNVFEKTNHWQHDLTDSLYETASESISQINDQLTQTETDPLPLPSAQRLLGKLADMMRSVESTLTSCEELAGTKISDKSDSFLPIDTRLIFNHIKEKFVPQFEANETELSVHDSGGDSIAVANPFLLREIFVLIFDILLKRSFAGSQICVAVDQIDHQLRYEFRDSGGVENQSRDNFARKSEGQTDREILDREYGCQLQEIRGWLDQWGGTFKVFNCDQGKLNIELLLGTQLLHSPVQRDASPPDSQASRERGMITDA